MKRGARFTAATAHTEAAVVALLMNHIGPDRAATWDQLARGSGIGKSVLRGTATGKLDGVSLLLGYRDDDGSGAPYGVFVCETPEQGERMTAGLLAQATTEMQRAQRRADFAARMRLWPAKQLGLFDGRAA